MEQTNTKALFTCTQAGYDTALRLMKQYRDKGMLVVFYGIAEEKHLLELAENNGMTHVLHFLDEENLKLVRISDEMGVFTVDITVQDLI